MDTTVSFGYWLRRRRKALDLTQEALAREVSCAVVTIRKIEADAMRPSVQIAERLAACLHIPSEERGTFLRVARAELSPDRLPLAGRSVDHTTGRYTVQPWATPAPPDLPSGTITFLFTDIEGSTRLWEQHPRSMQIALARHDTIVHQAINEHRGVVFKTIGDEICAAFTRAPDALATAVAIQRALLAERWDVIDALRVRIALHTSTAQAHDGDYIGPPLNRIARLLSAGHGGQILLSHAAEELVRDHLPSDVQLCDLGQHRLRDLERLERIYQVIAPDLPSNFPPLKTLDAHLTNLPAQPNMLIGREQEVMATVALLRRKDARLVTLTGPGGIGKTRLALQAAVCLLDDFINGVYFIPLSPITDPWLVLSAMAQTLNVKERGDLALMDSLKAYLCDKHMLMVLDNFEQVLAAAAYIADLLATAPLLKILVTSRAILHLSGEHEFIVPPLTLPEKPLPPLDQLTQYEAVQLFIMRAQAIKRDFAVTHENASVVAEICCRLEGLPLAVELAAARAKIFAPQALLARLERRLPLLTGGKRDLPERQQALRSTIDWSYNLLELPQRTLFRRLAVFVDGCTLEAAEAVCNEDGNLPIDVLDGCTALVDNSLLQQMEGVDGAPRFAMLETIREYALECLEASGEAQQMCHRHANFFLTFAEAIEPKLTSADRSIWLERLDAEYSNLRASLSWSKETGNTELWLRLAAAMGWFWHFEGYYSEGRRWLAAALAQPALPSNSQVSLKALRSMGVLAFFQSDYIEARDWLEKSVTMARKLNDQRELAYALLYLASVRLWQGDYTPAHDFAEESVAIFREIGDKWSIALSLLSVGFVALDLGDYERAKRSLEESLALRRELDDKLGIAYVLGVLGEVVRRQGDHRRAIALAEEGLTRSRELRLKMAIGLALLNLGELAHYQGDYERARDVLRESLAMYRDLGLKRDIARCLEALTGLASAEGQPEHGVRLCAAAAALRDRIDAPLPPSERADHDRSLAAMRAQLSAVAFATGWAEGGAMTLDQAIVYALQTPTSRV